MRNKKAFTVVELVIVIAIIAILAAVLIPTFANIIKKANENSDIQACRNINTSIAIEMALSNVNTCHDAIVAATNIGYSIDKFEPKTEGYHFIWNQGTKMFALINKDNEVVYGEKNEDNSKNWIISETYDESIPYQIYLKDGYAWLSLDCTKGVDVGYNENLNVKYTGTQPNVTIRTNKGIFTVDSTAGNINHYGVTDTLNIIQCDTASYHEWGTVNSELNIAKGRFVLEATGVIPAIVITADNANDVVIENKKSSAVYLYAESEAIKNGVAVSGPSEKIDKLGKIVFEGDYYEDFSEIISLGIAGKTAKLLSNLIYGSNSSITFPSSCVITVDLNGHNIEGSDSVAGAFAFITVEGDLTIKDSLGTGKISYASTTPDPSWGYGTNTIVVGHGGVLTLESGTIANNTVYGASYAVDLNTTTGNATFNMNGGFLRCDNGDQAVRLFANSTSFKALFNMSSGEITTGGFWLQQPTTGVSTLAEVNITGGTINGMIDLMCYNTNEQKVVVSGATIETSKLRIRSSVGSFITITNSTISISALDIQFGTKDQAAALSAMTIDNASDINWPN